MQMWSLLLLSLCCLASGNVISVHHSEGPRRPGAFIDPNGNVVVIEAGDVGYYETGMYDDTINYIKDVQFYLYTRDNVDDPQQLFLDDSDSVINSNFDHTKLTKIIVHGFMNNLNSSSIQLNKNSFLSSYDFNVIGVNWGSLACDILYPVVVSKVPAVGKYVGQFVNFLVTKASVNASDVHIIGHSLGAHVAGFAGKEIQDQGYSIARITGLDPALPGYVFDKTTTRLAKTDADYVDVIHTCGGFLGFMSAIGQADFYPNGGIDPQPGCPLLIDLGSCSHSKSYKYFAASINPTNKFEAKSCKAILLGIPIGCSGYDGALMGYPDGEEQSKGKYYLKTEDVYPYAESDESL